MSEAPGAEWQVLGASSQCECGWVGLALSRSDAMQMWVEHAKHADHDMKSTSHTEEGI